MWGAAYAFSQPLTISGFTRRSLVCLELIFKEVDRYGSYFTLLHVGESFFQSVSDSGEQILELSSQWEPSRFQLFLTPGSLVCALPMVQAAFAGVFSFLFFGFPGSSRLVFLYYSCLLKGFFMSLEVLPMVQRRRKGIVPSWREWKHACVQPSGLGGVPVGLCELSRMISS